MLPLPVLERAQEELLSFRGSGMSVMELSHRSTLFGEVLGNAETGIRSLLGVPENYSVLFLQGGASLQFVMVPLNLLKKGEISDYLITGYWGTKAVAEAERIGTVKVVYSSEESGYREIPEHDALSYSPDSSYVHYTSNETIDGVEFDKDLEAGGIPIVCDASSNILSKPIDVEKYGLIYAGAQKNIGPSGVTLVIIRNDLLERGASDLHPILSYRKLAESHSMVNTPNTWGIYIIGLVCEWLREQGGLESMKLRNEEKARILYKAIDSSDGYYLGHARPGARSNMNVTFRLASENLERRFIEEAAISGLNGLAGHRTVGGIRASIYNAFPKEGVQALVDFMEDFVDRHS